METRPTSAQHLASGARACPGLETLAIAFVRWATTAFPEQPLQDAQRRALRVNIAHRDVNSHAVRPRCTARKARRLRSALSLACRPGHCSGLSDFESSRHRARRVPPASAAPRLSVARANTQSKRGSPCVRHAHQAGPPPSPTRPRAPFARRGSSHLRTALDPRVAIRAQAGRATTTPPARAKIVRRDATKTS